MNRIVFVLVASVAFATSGPLARLSRPEHPLVVALTRVALAAAVLIALSARSLRMPRSAIAGGVLLAAHFACFLWGIDTTSLPAAIALVALEPLSVVLWAWILHRDRPTRLEAIGVLVATLGGVVVSRGAGAGEHRLLGDVLVLIAVALYGLYVAVVRHTRDVMPATAAAGAVYLVAAIALALAVALAPIKGVWPLPGGSLAAMVALAIVPTLLGHTMVQAASRVMSPSVVALVSPGESVLGIAIAALLMGARPSAIEGIGAIVIVAGATIAIVGGQPPGEGSVGGTPPPPMHGGVKQAQRPSSAQKH